ncbi:hypothetical protein K7432_008551 [Basidiobolus ranarum]|uniref:Uncharacterized protein n=1 Tax=Basidiobolus ranarum TaxID=34480 RepID=A0ABR2WRM8_9FUNG
MVENIYINDKQQEETWAFFYVPGVRVLTEMVLFIVALLNHIWESLCRCLTKTKESNPPLISTIQSNYSSIDYSHNNQEVTEITPNHTIIPIDVKPILEKRPSTVSYLSYAPSVWSLDNRILGQLNQLEQAQSYLFRSINILIDSQEELDDVEQFVGGLSWGQDLSELSKMKYVN